MPRLVVQSSPLVHITKTLKHKSLLVVELSGVWKRSKCKELWNHLPLNIWKTSLKVQKFCLTDQKKSPKSETRIFACHINLYRNHIIMKTGGGNVAVTFKIWYKPRASNWQGAKPQTRAEYKWSMWSSAVASAENPEFVIPPQVVDLLLQVLNTKLYSNCSHGCCRDLTVWQRSILLGK